MANNLKNLIEEWEYRAGDVERGSPEDVVRSTAIKECIEDLKSTLHIMEADEVVRKLSRNDGTHVPHSGARTYAGDLALRIRRP